MGRVPTGTRSAVGLLLALIALVLLFSSTQSAHAVTLTYKMQPNERACFYANSIKPDEKIAFYYAVSVVLVFGFQAPTI